MKYKIGIFGSAIENNIQSIAKARELGRELSKHNVILITGATTGIGNDVILEAAKNNTEIWGFAPTGDKKSLTKLTPSLNLTIYSKIFYIPKDYIFLDKIDVCRKYRNVSSTAACEAGIILSGQWGTMNEFTNLYDMGKVIGVLTGTGGFADELENLNKKINKPGKAVIIFEHSPKKLVARLLRQKTDAGD